jgi:hypothetical protein
MFSRAKKLAHTPCSVVGRKRSRDEAAVNLDSAEKVVDLPQQVSQDEWALGPGMTLIGKTTGYVADASSQSGTWVDETRAREETMQADQARLAQQQLSQSRPSLRSHKSQRITVPAAPSTTAERLGPNDADSVVDSPTPLAQPVVDDFTKYLGIGWSRISDEEHI